MYETAKQIGLPASFIDIRHDAIHGNLPSLTVLREVTRKALDWLWNDYWKHLDGNLRANEQDGRPTWDDQMEASKEQVRRILHGYRLAAPTTASSNNPKDSGITPETTNTCLRLVKVCKCEQPALSDLVSMLVKGDLIIPRSRLCESPSIPGPRGILILMALRLGDSMDDTFSLWEPLLKQLTYHQKPFLNLLTQMLINQIISPSLTEPEVDVHREAVHFWLLQIYTSQEWSSARKRGKINADDLLSICLQNPNFWTNPIACAIVNEPGGSRLGTIYEDRIDAPAMVTAQAAPHDSPTPKIPEGNLADLLAYQEVWLQAVEDSQKENIDPNIPTLPVGGWQKWVGEWTPKPFGTV